MYMYVCPNVDKNWTYMYLNFFQAFFLSYGLGCLSVLSDCQVRCLDTVLDIPIITSARFSV